MNIPVSVDAIRSLKLTQWGKIRLSAFHADAISYADNRLQKYPNVSQPFPYFVSICNQYTRDNNLSIDWSIVNALNVHYGTPENAHMLEEDRVILFKDISPKTSNKGESVADKARREAERESILNELLLRSKEQARKKHREWEEKIRTEDSVAYERYQSRAQRYRSLLSLDDSGSPLPGSTMTDEVRLQILGAPVEEYASDANEDRSGETQMNISSNEPIPDKKIDSDPFFESPPASPQSTGGPIPVDDTGSSQQERYNDKGERLFWVRGRWSVMPF